jgi:acyl dehydratase
MEERSEHMATLDGYAFDTVGDFVGREFGVSDWIIIDQETIDKFAESTGDDQWIHVDVERAKRESPYGTTIAHGFLVLSLLAKLQFDAGVVPPGVAQAINFGLDRVRFIAPVKSGARIRNRVVLLSAEEKGEGRMLLKTRNTIEVEGEEKPAMMAEMLVLLMALMAR